MVRSFLGSGRRVVAAVACLVGVSACGHLGMGGPAAADALIAFHNESLDQADVYAVAPGSEFQRIGTVFPGRVDTLRVRSSMLATGSGVNIVARLLARSNTPSSGNIPLHSGDMYDVTLTTDGRTLNALPSR
ncbi:MAG TPA: hypothetical protein VGM82_04545 [Gemmatimonadaceae bacterium]